MTNKTGTLYIVPTPLGNLEDITLRALRILKSVDLICAEDTRHSQKLLNHFEINTKITSYYREKERKKTPALLSLLREGKNLALISDAGTPAISDPGAILISEAHKAGITVVPLPGASAIPTAFSASGITAPGFLFLGFPPAKTAQRKKLLEQLRNEPLPILFYESPRRIEALLQEALEIFGDRNAFWARELSKNHEELLSEPLSTLLERAESGVKGELVLIICPGEKEEITEEKLTEILLWHRDNSTISVRDVSKKLSQELHISKSAIYQQALSLWKQKDAFPK